jgi:hypothetical protein
MVDSGCSVTSEETRDAGVIGRGSLEAGVTKVNFSRLNDELSFLSNPDGDDRSRYNASRPRSMLGDAF